MRLDIPEGRVVVPVALLLGDEWIQLVNYLDDRPREEFYAVFEGTTFVAGFTELDEAVRVCTPPRLLARGWLAPEGTTLD